MQKTVAETFYPKSQKAWRQWLQKNHEKKQSIWLVCYKAKSGRPSISWSDAVDEALCFGWIDSTRKTIDEEKFVQFFSKRKTGSTWSKINKEKVKRLIDGGLMAPAGFDSIERAKQNGTWSVLDDVEELVIPKDLQKEFKSQPGSKSFFMSLSKSVKKMMLQWITLAKRPETRDKRIKEIALHSGKKQKPKQFA
jgi:uncharacterized protein YdeI (YjbR/CyaY-like superfamily)